MVEIFRPDRDLQVLYDVYLAYAELYNGAVDNQEVHDVIDVLPSANSGPQVPTRASEQVPTRASEQVPTRASEQVSTRVTAPDIRPTSYRIGDVLEHKLGDQKGQRIRLLRYVDKACGKKRVNYDFFEYEETMKICCKGEQVIKYNPKKYKIISSIAS
jgi:hypothetical protein